jgi:hypothetical protein
MVVLENRHNMLRQSGLMLFNGLSPPGYSMLRNGRHAKARHQPGTVSICYSMLRNGRHAKGGSLRTPACFCLAWQLLSFPVAAQSDPCLTDVTEVIPDGETEHWIVRFAALRIPPICLFEGGQEQSPDSVTVPVKVPGDKEFVRGFPRISLGMRSKQ